jgi:hypothetical protein
MAKKGMLLLVVLAAMSVAGCVTQYNNLLQPTTAGSTGIEAYTVRGAVSIVSVGVGSLANPLSYQALLDKAKSIYGDKVSKVINVQVNSYEDKFLGLISISRKTEMAGIAVE